MPLRVAALVRHTNSRQPGTVGATSNMTRTVTQIQQGTGLPPSLLSTCSEAWLRATKSLPSSAGLAPAPNSSSSAPAPHPREWTQPKALLLRGEGGPATSCGGPPFPARRPGWWHVEHHDVVGVVGKHSGHVAGVHGFRPALDQRADLLVVLSHPVSSLPVCCARQHVLDWSPSPAALRIFAGGVAGGGASAAHAGSAALSPASCRTLWPWLRTTTG